MATHDPIIRFFDSPGGPKGSKGAGKSMMVLTAKRNGDTLYFEGSDGTTYTGDEGTTQIFALINAGQDILFHSDLTAD